MTRFEYAAIFYGIVTALSIENVASSFHKLFEAGGRVRWHWMAPTNAIGTSIGALAVFWSAWVGRNSLPTNPTLLTFLPTASAFIVFYLMCAATLPDAVPEAGIDLKDFYFSTRRQFWTLAAAAVLLRFSVNIFVIVRSNFDPQIVRPGEPYLAVLPAVAAIAVSLIYVRAAWYHALGIIVITSTVILVAGPMKLV